MKLSKENAKLLDVMREMDSWRDPSIAICKFNHHRKKFDNQNISYMSSNASAAIYLIKSDEIEFDGIILASTIDTVEMASLLGDLPIYDDRDTAWLVIPINMLNGSCTNNKMADAANELIDNVDIAFDETNKNSFVLDSSKRFWWRASFRYCASKQFPDDLAYVYCRNRFLDLIDIVWNDSFIIRPRQRHQKKSVKTVSRASAIANLLLLDRGNFDVFEKKGKCAAWKVSLLKKLAIDPKAFSPEMQKVYHEVERLRDVADFWMTASDNYGWALRLATSDLEYDRIDETKEKIATMAKLIDLECYLDTYDAGVPACDILA